MKVPHARRFAGTATNGRAQALCLASPPDMQWLWAVHPCTTVHTRAPRACA